MKLITRQSKANEAAKSWSHQYSNSGFWGNDVSKQQTGFRLHDLGPTPDPDEVDKVIGNSSWTRTTCDECEAENVDVVMVGQDEDYDSRTSSICKSCLIKAMAIL